MSSIRSPFDAGQPVVVRSDSRSCRRQRSRDRFSRIRPSVRGGRCRVPIHTTRSDEHGYQQLSLGNGSRCRPSGTAHDLASRDGGWANSKHAHAGKTESREPGASVQYQLWLHSGHGLARPTRRAGIQPGGWRAPSQPSTEPLSPQADAPEAGGGFGPRDSLRGSKGWRARSAR